MAVVAVVPVQVALTHLALPTRPALLAALTHPALPTRPVPVRPVPLAALTRQVHPALLSIAQRYRIGQAKSINITSLVQRMDGEQTLTVLPELSSTN